MCEKIHCMDRVKGVVCIQGVDACAYVIKTGRDDRTYFDNKINCTFPVYLFPCYVMFSDMMLRT